MARINDAGEFPVPVKNRTQARRPAAGDSATRKNKRRIGVLGFSVTQLAMLAVCIILILLMVSFPMRNYFQQRGEIARLSQSVVDKKHRKQQLLDELAKYRSDAYLREQARIRLGVIEPGETAFRILATIPDEHPAGPTTPDGTPTDELGPWWEVLWDSIATPEKAPVLPEQPQTRAEASQPAPTPHPGMQAHVPGLRGDEQQPPAPAPAQPEAPGPAGNQPAQPATAPPAQ